MNIDKIKFIEVSKIPADVKEFLYDNVLEFHLINDFNKMTIGNKFHYRLLLNQKDFFIDSDTKINNNNEMKSYLTKYLCLDDNYIILLQTDKYNDIKNNLNHYKELLYNLVKSTYIKNPDKLEDIINTHFEDILFFHNTYDSKNDSDYLPPSERTSDYEEYFEDFDEEDDFNMDID